jgi:hypothetical protein
MLTAVASEGDDSLVDKFHAQHIQPGPCDLLTLAGREVLVGYLVPSQPWAVKSFLYAPV